MNPKLLYKAIQTSRNPTRRHQYTCDLIRYRLDVTPGWILLYSRVLDGRIVVVRDNQIRVETSHEIGNLPRFTRDELVTLAGQADGIEQLKALYTLNTLLDATFARKQ